MWVLPTVDPAYRRACLGTLHPSIVERTLVVDNSGGHNRGVAASWNLGRSRVLNSGAEWLVILSESVRFGEAAGLDLEAELRAATDPWIDTHLGWHLVAFRARTLRRVGAFDENFPAYLEDTDYLVRLALAGLPSPRENDLEHRWLMTIDASHTGTEHSIRAGLVTPDLGACRRYYRRKWGADEPGHEYATPFDRPDVDWTWWPEMGAA